MHRRIRITLAFSLLAAAVGASVYHLLSRDLFSEATSPSPANSGAILFRYDASEEQSLIQENRRSRSLGRNLATAVVLLQDWEVLVLFSLSPEYPFLGRVCLFQDGTRSPARPAGILPWGNSATARCRIPPSVRRLRPFEQPKLVVPGKEPSLLEKSPEIIRWTFLVYETLTTQSDVILFAKGVNTRQGVNFPADDLRCVFDGNVYTPVVSSCQEVFRCLHPDPKSRHQLSGGEISLDINGRKIPSVAFYRPPLENTSAVAEKHQLCACTMVFNVAKFLKEWVMYHSVLGVERFILYDNGSEDDLTKVVEELRDYNVTNYLWPWPKTQEAGFSHCATLAMDTCQWMMFIDVDEFVFSPSWANRSNPSQLLKTLLLDRTQAHDSLYRPIGQIRVRCLEFGPSHLRSHPWEGVTQGYNCRRRAEQRHKSIVLLEALDYKLLNVVHHFQLKKGYRGKKLRVKEGVVNHYKYQAWGEFKGKFRRRVSAYVVDWKRAVNPASKDRTPGLGYSPIEPPGWASRFCEVNDSLLQHLTRRWFGLATPTGYKMPWERSQLNTAFLERPPGLPSRISSS